MLAYNQADRLSVEQILSHPWVNGITATAQQLKDEFTMRKERVEQAAKAEKMVQAVNVGGQ